MSKKMTSKELEEEWANLRSQASVAVYVDDPTRGPVVREVCASPQEAGGYIASLMLKGYRHVDAVVLS